MRISRVYTRGGDKGKTSLVGGVRVDKDCRKLESYGTVDELLCLVGTARTVLSTIPGRVSGAKKASSAKSPVGQKAPASPASPADLEAQLRRVQNRLFDVGSLLATPAGQTYPGMPTLSETDVSTLEKEMDLLQTVLPVLDSFVLPGGSPANAALHQCRAVCRRAEREALRLAREEAVDPLLLKFLNRLSDWFFVLSRYAAWLEGAPEYLWEYGAKKGKANRATMTEAAAAEGSRGRAVRKPRSP
ncbi:MAG: cob(I)yrinic acid a,c-diamide adenosyltransferase [Fibrobacteres bacterium]|nr:cob(I)yrinic acid a,c-diamide adenosyltransferase [Fibrobacterota bacterium]